MSTASHTKQPAELPITGYVDRLSRRPGERMCVHVSVRDAQRFRATLVRVLSTDANPQGPGVRFERLPELYERTHAGVRHAIRLGSYAVAPGPTLTGETGYTWTALVWPGKVPTSAQVVIAHESEAGQLIVSLTAGGIHVELNAESGPRIYRLGCALQARRWVRIWVSANRTEVVVGAQPCDAHLPAVVERFNVPGSRLPSAGRFIVAARDAHAPREHFDGRIEDPAVLSGVRHAWPDPVIALSELRSSLIAGWDFSIGIDTQRVTDIGAQHLGGVLKNVPTRAVKGARWRGEEMCWSRRPAEYASIHFHSDDLGDCEWPVAFEFFVPDELPSGAYAFHLTCESGEDWIPFFILPRREGPHALIAFIAPTFTYQAYANHARGNYDDALRARVREWGAYPYDPEEYPIYGLSTYNWHRDGSGVAYSSRLRPMLPMRPAFVSINDLRGSGLRHYPADMQLLAWLANKGFSVDVITDEDLHDEGAQLLEPYRVVLTGTHPEYHTTRSLNAVRDYIDAGGQLAYVGGNGFYWRVAVQDDLPGVLEVRRAEGGIRAWAAEAGEYYQSLDRAYGGLWRRNGRDPQALVGVGFSVQGPFEGTYYRRTPESYDPRFAWLFKGVDTDIIGDYGLSGGGAAGYEMDRADFALGTQEYAVVVARAVGAPPNFYPASEEILYASTTANGESAQSLLRADMTYFETPAGGAVFSVGSITFCGSLWRGGFKGPVSQLLENLVREFVSRKAR